MHALYKTTANWDGTAIAQDLVKLLTNNLNFNEYSTSCDKSGSYIITNTVSGGWTLWDSIPASYTYIIASTEANGITPKYLRIVGSASSVTIYALTAWNPVTHMVPIGGATTPGLTIKPLDSPSNIATIVLWQTPAYIATQVNTAGFWQMPQLWGCELDRSTTFTDYYADSSNSASAIVGLGPAIVPSAQYTDTRWGYMNGRTYSNSGTETGNFYITALTLIVSGQYTWLARNLDDSSGPYIICPTYIAGGGVYNNNLNDYGTSMIGALRDVLTCTYTGSLAPLDEMSINGTLYSILRTNTGTGNSDNKCAFLVPKV